MAISNLAMLVYFALAGLVLLSVIPQTLIVNLVEGVAALVAAIALALRK